MTEQPQPLTLSRHPEHLAVVRLGPGAEVPDWARSATLVSITATASETSVVCAAADVPGKARSEGPFVAFSVDGSLDLGMTGVLSGLTEPLAREEIPVFVVSTFDTDWLLVPAERADAAATAWGVAS